MFRSAVMALALILAPVVADAQSETHRVAQGETLWAIAGRYYDTPTRWPEIYEANRGIVQDPHWIFPGEELLIPGLDATKSVTTRSTPNPTPHSTPPVTVARPIEPKEPSQAVATVTEDPARERPVDLADAAASRPAAAARPAPSTIASSAAGHDPESGEPRAALSPPHEPALPSGYGVRTGDEIETTFYTAGGAALASMEGTRLVDREGNLFLPLVGTVQVGGMDAARIRTELGERFASFYQEPVITVNVRLKVNVTGIVGQAGRYLLDPTATLIDALSEAGGAGLEFTISTNAAADLEHVQLIRDGQTTLLDLRPESVTPATLALRVQSGDWIHVPPKVRNRLRDDVTFWGGVLSLVTSAVAAVAVIAR